MRLDNIHQKKKEKRQNEKGTKKEERGGIKRKKL